MTDQDAAQRAREVGEQAETQLNQWANAGAAQAESVADQVEEQLDAAQASSEELAASAQDMAQNASDALGNAGQQAQAQAQDLSNSTPARLRQYVQSAQQQAETLAGKGRETFDTAAQKASDGVNQAGRLTGDTLRGAAGGVRSYAPQSGTGADIAERFASGLEHSGDYLERQSHSAIARFTNFVQHHPLAITLAGGGLVLLLLRRRLHG